MEDKKRPNKKNRIEEVGKELAEQDENKKIENLAEKHINKFYNSEDNELSNLEKKALKKSISDIKNEVVDLIKEANQEDIDESKAWNLIEEKIKEKIHKAEFLKKDLNDINDMESKMENIVGTEKENWDNYTEHEIKGVIKTAKESNEPEEIFEKLLKNILVGNKENEQKTENVSRFSEISFDKEGEELKEEIFLKALKEATNKKDVEDLEDINRTEFDPLIENIAKAEKEGEELYKNLVQKTEQRIDYINNGDEVVYTKSDKAA